MNNSPGHVKIATAVQAMWKELGLDVTLRVMEWAQFLQFLGPPPNADVDVYRLGWIYDFPDAYNGFVLWLGNSGNNNTNWKNATYDRLVKKAERTPGTAARGQDLPAAREHPHRAAGSAADHADLLVHVHRPREEPRQGLLDRSDEPLGLRERFAPVATSTEGQGAMRPALRLSVMDHTRRGNRRSTGCARAKSHAAP